MYISIYYLYFGQLIFSNNTNVLRSSIPSIWINQSGILKSWLNLNCQNLLVWLKCDMYVVDKEHLNDQIIWCWHLANALQAKNFKLP